jgi:hypothetical protein
MARGETVMHRLPRHENEHAPCNLYCHGDVHVDVIYLAPWLIEQAGTDLLGYLQGAWSRSGYDDSSEVLAISEAPEARTAHAHYPLSYRTRPVMTVPYRITYRVVER